MIKKIFIKNKRGDIPIMILVLGVFLICALAILSFFYSDNKISREGIGVEAFENLYSNIEEFDFYLNLGLSETEAIERASHREDIEMKIQGTNLFVEKNYRSGKLVIDIEYTKNLD